MTMNNNNNNRPKDALSRSAIIAVVAASAAAAVTLMVISIIHTTTTTMTTRTRTNLLVVSNDNNSDEYERTSIIGSSSSSSSITDNHDIVIVDGDSDGSSSSVVVVDDPIINNNSNNHSFSYHRILGRESDLLLDELNRDKDKREGDNNNNDNNNNSDNNNNDDNTNALTSNNNDNENNTTYYYPDSDIDGRIVGGTESQCGEYPWFVAGYSGNSFMCGASLITPSIIMCAAHCSPVIDNVKIGLCDKGRVHDESHVEHCRVIQKVDCPLYGQGFPSNKCDVALFKLDCTSKAPVVTINVDPQYPIVGQSVTAVGMGAIREGGPSSMKLLQVNVNYITNLECKKAYGTTRITDDMLCAGVPGGQKDACQGDSGGPLIVQGGGGGGSATGGFPLGGGGGGGGRGNNNPHVLIGCVSWGKGCARAGNPGVYYRTSFNRNWIEKTVKELSGQDEVSKLKLRLPGGSISSTTITSGGGNVSPPPPPPPTPKPTTPAPISRPIPGGFSPSPPTGGSFQGPSPYQQQQQQQQQQQYQGPSPSSSLPQIPEQPPCGYDPNTGLTIICHNDPYNGPTGPAMGPAPAPAQGPAPSVAFQQQQGGGGPTSSSTTTTTQLANYETTIFQYHECIPEFNKQRNNNPKKCIDMKFMGRRNKFRTCTWVNERISSRCLAHKFRYCCPLTCQSCNENPQIVLGTEERLGGGKKKLEEGGGMMMNEGPDVEDNDDVM